MSVMTARVNSRKHFSCLTSDFYMNSQLCDYDNSSLEQTITPNPKLSLI